MSTSGILRASTVERRHAPSSHVRGIGRRGARALEAVAALWLAVGLAPARAEIAPEYYARDQAKAPERLTLKVRSVDTSACPFEMCDSQDVTATAEVTEVIRSASGLKPGAVITLKWKRVVPSRGWSGPRPLRALAVGESVPAWLHKSEAEHYEPAARGYSFGPDRSDALPPEPGAPPTPPAPALPPSTPAVPPSAPAAPPSAPATPPVSPSAPTSAPAP